MTKSRKDNLRDPSNNHDNQANEDKMSSFENQNDFYENRQIISSEMVKALQARIGSLNKQLTEEQSKYEDLTIQYKNSLADQKDLRSKLQAVYEGVRTLHLTREEFPPNFGQVFESQDCVFAVEFKGTKVLDITVITQNQAANDKITYASNNH